MSLVQVAPPRLRTAAEEGERSATWLELFYDLVFVVAVAVLVERLVNDISGAGVASFFGYFALLWWLWASHTYYADRYDTDDLVYRLLAAGQMVAIVVLAASLSGDAAGSTRAFAFAYAVSRFLLLVMYWRAYRHVSETRRLVKGYLIGFGVAAVVWTASALVPEDVRVVLWAVALCIDLLTPWVMRSEQDGEKPLQADNLKAPYNDPFSYFMAVIREEIKPSPEDLSSLDNNLVVMSILQAAITSARSGKKFVLRDAEKNE